MATNNPRGLVPTRTLRGDSNFKTKRYSVSAGNPNTLFAGDPVKLFSGHVRRVSTSAVSAGDPPVLGVIAGVYNSNGRPFTHNLPGSPNALPALTAGFVDVYDDPDIVYLANGDSAMNQAQVGQLVRVTAGSANTAAGISGFSIKVVDATNNAVGHHFQIIGLGNNERIEGETFGAHQDLEVLISDHQFRRRVVMTGTASVAVG